MTLPDFLILAHEVALARSPKSARAPAPPDADMIAALRRMTS